MGRQVGIFFLTWTTRMHIVALIMLPNINYVLLFTWDIFALYQLWIALLISFGKFGKILQSGVLGTGRSGYTKHNYFLPYLEY